MTPRYELRAVRLDGEVYPAIVDSQSKDALPFIYFDKDKPSYRELIRLIAEYRVSPEIGFQVRDILNMPHYLSDDAVKGIRERDAKVDKKPEFNPTEPNRVKTSRWSA